MEYALAFDGGRPQNPKEVQPSPKPLPSEDQLIKLQEAIGDMTKRMEALESALTAERTANRTGSSSTPLTPGPVGSARRNNRNRRPVICFRCNQEGHIRRNCPLKLRRASSNGGELAETILNRQHQLFQPGSRVNTVLLVGGQMGLPGFYSTQALPCQ